MAILLAAPLASAQAAPIVNGGFEAGTLEGWTATSATGNGEWAAITGTKPPLSGQFENTVLAPFEGTYDAIADELDPDSMVLSQEVALKPGVSHELSLELNYRSAAPFVTPSPDTLGVETVPNQQVLVDVMKAGSPASSVEPSDILATLLQTEAGDPEEIGWTRLSADLTPFAGQTVRIRVVDANNESNLNVGVDAVTVTNQTEVAPIIPTPVAPVIAAPAPTPTCTVPKLKGKKLKAAKKAIRSADCKVGTVTKKKGVTGKSGKVVTQSPKVGTSKAAGSKVSFKLG
jgi:PASTA domain